MKFNKILAFALAAVAAVSCSLEQLDGDKAKGFVTFAIADNEQIADVTKSAVSDFTALPASSSFQIEVKNADASVIYNGPVTGWDAEQKLQIGRYTVTASYGAEGVEGFDKPYFVGTTEFDIIGGETTSVSIPVSLGNCVVKVVTTPMFKNYFPSYSFLIVTGSGAEIPFNQSETRGTFVDAYKFAVSGQLTTVNGKTVDVPSKNYNELAPATCYTLTFDVTNVGGFSLSISFNDTVQTVDLGEVELN